MATTLEPTVHDFFKTSYTWQPRDGGQQGHMFLFTILAPPGKGDYILLRAKGSPDGRSRYQVISVKHYRDPGDMYGLELQFAPRTR